MAESTFRELLRQHDFRVYFAARSISLLGAAIAPIGLAFAILHSGQPAGHLGIVLGARVVPQIVLLLFGGLLGDLLPRRTVLVVTDLGSAITQGATAVLFMLQPDRLWAIVVLQAISGACISIFYPASVGMVPELLQPSLLQAGNGALSLAWSSTTIVGGAIGGLLVGAVGAAWALAADSLSFVASAVLIRSLPGDRPGGAPLELGGTLAELGQGLREVAARHWLRLGILVYSCLYAMTQGAVLVLGPMIADRQFGGPRAWGTLLSVEAAGSFAVGLLLLRVRFRRPLLAGACFLALLAPYPLLLSEPVGLVALGVASVVMGVGYEAFIVLWNTALQLHVPRAALSRVAAVDGVGSFALLPLAFVVVAPVAELASPSAVLVAAGLSVVAGAGVLLAARSVRELPGAPN